MAGRRSTSWIYLSTCRHVATMTFEDARCACSRPGGCGQVWVLVAGRGFVPVDYGGDHEATRVPVDYTPRVWK